MHPKSARVLNVALVLLAAATVAPAQDRIDSRPPARFTNGLHVNVRGGSRALFVDGPAAYAPPGLVEQTITIHLDLQATVRVGDRELAPGRHRVSLELSPRTDWRLQLDDGPVSLEVTAGAVNEVDLAVRFARTTEDGAIDLVVAWGTMRGRVRCVVEPGLRRPAADDGEIDPESLDASRLREIRDRLLDAADRLIAASRTRSRWIDAMVAIREAASTGGRVIQLFDVKVERTGGAVRLTLAGESHGQELEPVNRFADALRDGPLGKIFPAVGRPAGEVVRNVKGAPVRWRFVILCDCPESAWTPNVERATGRAEAGDIAALTEEVAFLDRWLTAFAGPSRSVGNVRSKMRALLDLRRETAVSLPALDPGESIDELGGAVLRYPVAMVALGHYDGLVRFLDGLEAWQAPMTWELTAMTHDELGTRTKLAIDFLSYRSPTVDSPALRVALAAVGSQEGHDERLAAYVAALPPLGRRDRYQPPETVPRDPFVDPATAARMAREDEEGASGR